MSKSVTVSIELDESMQYKLAHLLSLSGRKINKLKARDKVAVYASVISAMVNSLTITEKGVQ